jgi:hypothetical protein
METAQAKPHFSLPSLIALGAAIASLFVGALGGFILALIAIAFGVIGFLFAMSPSVRGGFISLLSLVVAAIGVIVAVIRAFSWIM